jgi:ribosomal protein S18 acetylase RimI-like enzyme
MPDPLDELTFRSATPEDAAALADFARRTFVETYAADNRPEDMETYVAGAFGEARQGAEIANPDGATILGEAAGRIAAYVQLRRGPAPACVDSPAPVEIMRFYVDRPWHGRGVAQRMMDAALRTARELGGGIVWLSAWEKNPRAFAFYRKLGFGVAGRAQFLLGNDLQDDYVMTIALDESHR